jgi:GT2 family glycosyltransferase
MRYLLAIPNYSRQLSDIRMLNRCIKSILQHEPMSEADIWIFDDGSPYFDKELMIHKRIIRRETNMGYSATVNDAIKFAQNYKYDGLVTINSDVEILKPFLTRADHVFNFDKQIAVIGGLLLYPNGRIQSAGYGLTDEGTPSEYNKHAIFAHFDHDASNPKYVYGVTGALQIIKVPYLAKIGVYDQGFQLSYEDVEFCYRTWAKGYRCFYDPHIRANHAESESRGYHVGAKEYSSFKHWLKKFKPKQHAKNLQAIADAAPASRSAQISHTRQLRQDLAAPIESSKQSCDTA